MRGRGIKPLRFLWFWILFQCIFLLILLKPIVLNLIIRYIIWHNFFIIVLNLIVLKYSSYLSKAFIDYRVFFLTLNIILIKLRCSNFILRSHNPMRACFFSEFINFIQEIMLIWRYFVFNFLSFLCFSLCTLWIVIIFFLINQLIIIGFRNLFICIYLLRQLLFRFNL